MSVTWVVRFCEGCFGAFDVEDKGNRLPEFCDDCKRERKRACQRRYMQERRRPRRVSAHVQGPEEWMLVRRQQGRSLREIAVEAGCSYQTVRRRFARSR